MSYALPGYYDAPATPATRGGRAAAFDAPSHPAAAAAGPDLIFVPRSNFQWLAFIPALILCSASWAAGGVPALTDAGFALMTLACGVFLAAEFFNFPRRFGIGGMVLYGGVLCWFCHDYFTRWFNLDFVNSPYHMPPIIIAKAAALHVGFIMCMSASINWRFGPFGIVGGWVERFILAVPDPGSMAFYLVLVVFLFVVGISPYLLFNAEPWYMALYHSAFAGWTGGAQLNVFRTGNLNTSWSAYAAQLIQVGQVGGIFTMMFGLLIARTWPQRLLAVVICTYWALTAFASDRRGDISFTLMPLICIVFIKYQSRAAVAFKRFSLRAYLVCGLMTVGLLFVVQFQGTYRGVGFGSADLSKLELTKNQGNTMFSEGLLGYKTIPDERPFFRDQYGIDGAVYPLVDNLFWFVTGPIPAPSGSTSRSTRCGRGTIAPSSGPATASPGRPSPADSSAASTSSTASGASSRGACSSAGSWASANGPCSTATVSRSASCSASPTPSGSFASSATSSSSTSTA